jgi:GABA(A) receptor-associated protein
MYNLNLFKNQHNFKERESESNRIMSKYPDRVPFICQRSQKAFHDSPYIDKTKYLVPKDLTMGQFLYVIRKRLKLPSEKALFIFVNNYIPSTSQMAMDIYNRHKDPDGFLYLYYSCENTFG